MDKLKEAIEISKKIQEKEKESYELLKKLKSSLVVQGIWPEAFENGQKCSTLIKRDTISPTQYRREGRKRIPIEPKRYGYLKREDGKTRSLSDQELNAILESREN